MMRACFVGSLLTTLPLVFNATRPVQFLRLTATYDSSATPSSLSAQATVCVRVRECNHPPVFNKTSYNITMVPDRTPPGSMLTYVTASDSDLEYGNSRLEYSLLTGYGGMDAYYFLFDVGLSTGAVLLVDQPPAGGQYKLIILVSDGGDPPLNSTTTVWIGVTMSPLYVGWLEFTRTNYSTVVSESLPVLTEFISVRATSGDPLNNQISYLITSGAAQDQCISVYSNNGSLFIRSPLNYETFGSYQLVLSAFLGANTPLSVSTQNPPSSRPTPLLFTVMSVGVSEVNKFSPQFAFSSYSISVESNSSSFTYLFTAQAPDKDRGPWGVVTYTLSPFSSTNNNQDYRMFSVDSSSGEVATATYISTNQNAYKFKITATDAGGLNATSDVIVTVTMATTQPTFLKSDYMFTVPGNSQIGDTVGQVQAVGEGGLPLSNVIYFLLQPSSYFSVNSTTGVIYLIKDLLKRTKRSVNRHVRGVRYDTSRSSNWSMVRGALVESSPMFNKHTNWAYQSQINRLSIRPETNINARRRIRAAAAGASQDNMTLIIVVQSGLLNPKQDEATVVIAIDTTCPGCALTGVIEHQGGSSGTLSRTSLIILIVFVIVGVALIITVVALGLICYRRRHKTKKAGNANARGVTNLAAMDIQLSPVKEVKARKDQSQVDVENVTLPNKRGEDTGTRLHSMSTEMRTTGAESRGASSGRGSSAQEGRGSVGAVGDEMDEEIRMINSCQSLDGEAGLVRDDALDSGIAREDEEEDSVSDLSIRNHVDYLARLGVDTSRIDDSRGRNGQTSQVKESGGVNIGSRDIEQKGQQQQYERNMNDIGRPDVAAMNGSSRVFGAHDIAVNNPSVGLSAIINNEEVLSGSYNWDYLLGWGPQYLPLADVFAELATLKDDTLAGPPRNPPQLQRAPVRIGPPPIITDTPPHNVTSSAFNPTSRVAPISRLTRPHPQPVNQTLPYDVARDITFDLQHPAMMRQYARQLHMDRGAGRSRSPSLQSDHSARQDSAHMSASIHLASGVYHVPNSNQSNHSNEHSSSRKSHSDRLNHSNKRNSSHIQRSDQSNHNYYHKDTSRIEEEDHSEELRPAGYTPPTGYTQPASSARPTGHTPPTGSARPTSSKRIASGVESVRTADWQDTPVRDNRHYDYASPSGSLDGGMRLADTYNHELSLEYHHPPYRINNNVNHQPHHQTHGLSVVHPSRQSNFIPPAMAPPFTQTLSPLGAQSPAYFHDVLPARHVNLNTGNVRRDTNKLREAQV